MRIGVGQAEAVITRDAARHALDQAHNGLHGATPDAALVFAHVDADTASLLATLAEYYPGLPVVGCSTAGEYGSPAGFSEDSIVVILLQSDTVDFATGLGRNASSDPAGAAADALAQAQTTLPGPAKLCLFFPDGRASATDQVLSALGDGLPKGCPIFGAASARVGTSDVAPLQMFGNDLIRDGVPILLLGGDIQYAFSVGNSWEPVGGLTIVEQTDGRNVGRIGGRSAMEFYQHYLGPHAKPASEFPLAIHDPEADRFYLRVPTGYDTATGTISFGADVPHGAMVQLSEATPQRILDETDRAITNSLSAFDGTPALALAFSCNARKGVLGTRAAEEPALLTRHLGGVPFAGFFGFAEISPLSTDSHRPHLHHATFITLLMGDGTQPIAQIDIAEVVDGVDAPDVLRRKLRRSEYYRQDLEQIRDGNAALLRTVGREIEEARRNIAEQKAELEELHAALTIEQEKSEGLLRNILPGDVAEELKERGTVEPVFYDNASILFTDFVGFTTRAAQLSPKELVSVLDTFFSAFDAIASQHGLEKLKTIGDAYMCVGGVPRANDTHAADMVRAALDMQSYMAEAAKRAEESGEPAWQLRVGIHTGPLMAGVIGTSKFAYDVWGDTVNIAARLESAGEAGRVNVSQAVHDTLVDAFTFTHRGQLPAKNVGDIDMYFVDTAPD